MTRDHVRLTGERSREYADRLLVANDPDEVAAIVEELEDDHAVQWKPLGEDENNYSDVFTQAAAPMASFTELPMNAGDSLMLRFFTENADDSVDPHAYSSMKEAVEADWVDMDDAEIEIIADGLKPQDGNLLNLTVRDNGLGKGREEFRDFVGLHSPGLKKQEYGFLQGQYGMGSTAVMQFAGNVGEEYNERAFKFIASASSEVPGEWSWTLVHDKPRKGQVDYLTVGGDFPVFDGEFGAALAEKFRESYPDEHDIDANATVHDPQTFGAFVKVFDYQTRASRALISGSEGFRRKLERSIVDAPFPITLTDMRYNSKVPQSSTQGFLPQLRKGREHLLEGEEHISFETGSETLGERTAHVLLFKSDDRLEDVETTNRGKDDFVASTSRHKGADSRTGIQRDHAVMLTINGQTHGSKGEYFLRSIGYSKIAKDTVVIVEFDDLANLGMVRMFSPSRDSLKDSPQASRFLPALEDALENSDLLSDEEDRRRARRGSEETSIDAETFAEFVDHNPDFLNRIMTGELVTGPRIRPSDTGVLNAPDGDPNGSGGRDRVTEGDGEEETGEEQFDTPLLPTYLRPIREYDPGGDHVYWDETDGIMPVEMPVNRGTTIRFETDAQSNYLVREVLRGTLNVSPSARFGSVELQDGLLTLTIRPAEDAEVGDDFGLTVELIRPDPEECELVEDPAEAFPDPVESDEEIRTDGGTLDTSPLTSMFTVEYVDPFEKPRETPSDDGGGEDPDGEGDEGGPDDQESGNGDSGDSGGDWAFDMPEIITVNEEQWRVDDDGEPFDEDSFDPEIAGEFDEHTLIRIDESRDGTISGLTLTINLDPALLRAFIVENNVRESWKEFVENHYLRAVVFYAISDYRELVSAYGEALEGSEIMTTEIVEHTINGLGPALMPTIIPGDQLDRITE